MNAHEIDILIQRYLDGETTPAEEQELALAVQREDRPAEWAIIAEMLGELTVDEAVFDEIMMQRAAKESPLPQHVSAKRTIKLWPWAAAACIALAFGLSYNIMKETQETAKVETPPSAQPKPENKPATKPLLASKPKPTPQKPQRQIEQPSVEEPPFEASMEEPLLESQAEEPLPEPQLIAELEEATPPEDLSLCMALIAEVEARAFQVEQSEQQLYQALLDELLFNIQQQSNRPELSL